tara:strand:- start:631 stop:1179 length:549 start_codon:yes stop_codon:yes gene_type:complete
MEVKKTNFKGLYIFDEVSHIDKRGLFQVSFSKNSFKKVLENINFTQENISHSKRGVIRGLHFQKPPYSQSKLLKCVSGKILDIAVDLRKDSKTYKKYHSIILSSEENRSIFIPKGFAHGFLVLSEHAIVHYKVDNIYSKSHESGIKYNDPELNIHWSFDEKNIIISEKDLALGYLENIETLF